MTRAAAAPRATTERVAALASPPPDDAADTCGFRSSGSSPTSSPGSAPTLHLLGPGLVGRAFLELAAGHGLRLIGVTDTTATVYAKAGLDPLALAHHKAAGHALATLPEAEPLPLDLALSLVAADVVVDATPSDVRRADPAVQRALRVLRGGSHLVLAAKGALAAAPQHLLAPHFLPRLWFDAVLGGTGRWLRAELADLRRQAAAVALVANASTTAVLLAVERGQSLDDGIAAAQALGALEPDPTLDLDGSDAAAKLQIVAGAMWGEPLPRQDIVREDLRLLDLDLVRWRRAHGRTTRLVGRAAREVSVGGDGDGRRALPAAVRYEEVALGSPLAVPPDRVAYTYALGDVAARDGWRVHVGHGVGPAGTAKGLLHDVLELCGASAQGGAR